MLTELCEHVVCTRPTVRSTTQRIEGAWFFWTGFAQVDALAGSMSRPMQSVSMGSSEGFDMADRALHMASKQG